MITAVYGGSFNPPHLGHRSAVDTINREIAPDRILIMPDYRAPHKEMAENTPTPEQRLKMCELAFGDAAGVEISELEIRRGGRSYTVDTMTELTQMYPDDKFLLVVGSDMLKSFTTGWYRFEDILKMCALTVMSREGDDIDELKRCAEYLKSNFAARVDLILNHKSIVISSSRIREALISNDGNTLAYLNPEVLSYIRNNRLYV